MYQNGRVIVAINALGLGIDIPDIRLIVHLEMPRRISDYGQQSRHAGRDGLPYSCIPVIPCLADVLQIIGCRDYISSANHNNPKQHSQSGTTQVEIM